MPDRYEGRTVLQHIHATMTMATSNGYLRILFLFYHLFISLMVSAQLFYFISDPRDDRDYRIVKIGDQWWMAENLNVGSMINTSAEQQDNGTIEKYCPDNENALCEVYGGLYRYDEMMQYGYIEFNQGICPSDWHIPSDHEWKILELSLGMSSDILDNTGWRGDKEGGMLKDAESLLWFEPNACATDEVGFSLLPAGFVTGLGNFSDEGFGAYYYCADKNMGIYPWIRNFSNNQCGINRDDGIETYAHSVRCVKNSPYVFGRGGLTDTRDGQEYSTVLIGNHWWMAENLNYGTWIDTLGEQKNNGIIEKYCYSHEGGYCKENGGLYQWDEMMNYDPGNRKGICPDGWHVPTEDDWAALEYAAGMPESDLDKTGWIRGSLEGELLREGGGSGFEAQLAGGISEKKKSQWMDEFGFLWSSDPFNKEMAWLHVFYADTSTIGHSYYSKKDALSVRCVSDDTEIMTVNLDAAETVCAGESFELVARVTGGTAHKRYSWTSDPPGIYPEDSIIRVRASADTKYRVRVMDGYLYTSDTVTVRVIPLPVFTVTGENVVCPSEETAVNYAVSFNPDFSYFWNATDGDILSGQIEHEALVKWPISGIKAISLQVTDNNTGCADRKNFEVEVLPAPSKPFVRQKGNHLLICPDSGRLYQWYQNDVAIEDADRQFFYAKSNKSGFFQVETRKDNQCKSISDPFSFSMKSTGEPGDETQNVFIRPNPTGGHIILDIINDYNGQVSISVFSSMGSMIRQYNRVKQTQVFESGIDLGGLDEGLYIVMVEYGMKKEVQRLTMKH